MTSKALVVLSGGQDSATCAAWAATVYDEIECVSFDYGQRHAKELDAARKLAALFGARHDVISVDVLKGNQTSALTAGGSVSEADATTGLPKSFVPGRNLIFLASAASLAASRGISEIVTGVCQTDFSGYPDCRRATMDALEGALSLGLGPSAPGGLRIITPLMHLTKAETVRLARRLPKGWDAVALSWTCYEGGETPCQTCPACVLRAKGFAEAGLSDPAI